MNRRGVQNTLAVFVVNDFGIPYMVRGFLCVLCVPSAFLLCPLCSFVADFVKLGYRKSRKPLQFPLC